MRNHPAIEQYQQVQEESSDEDGGVLPTVRQPAFNRNIDRDRDPQIKVDIPDFNGEEQLEEVLDWLNEVQRVYDFFNLSGHKKVKFVAIKLKGICIFLVGASVNNKSSIQKWKNPELDEDATADPEPIPSIKL